ncbi:PAS domain-containing protein [uncultured Paracoccus sp.]|uniref:PAS domain-containing protein n=1 Tax=uncultured Paracoccus sp. TaxID=189685 RepID=UPI002612ADB2|nr:PAS domain-containing protein [uncultured Paracoccus sp.]
MPDDNQKSGDLPPGAGGRVLHLAEFDANNPARILADLRDYWQSLRRGRAIPLRSEIEPKGIRGALDYAFILERVAPGAARFRLAGRHLIDLMGMEVRGMPLCAFLNPGSRGRLSDVLETVFHAPQLAELTLVAKAEYARPALAARMLLMPLRSDLGDVTRALGCLISEGEPGSVPRRFDLVRERILPIFEGAEILAPSASAPGFAEPPTDWRRTGLPTPAAPARPATPAAPAPTASAPATALPESPEDRRARFRVVIRND